MGGYGRPGGLVGMWMGLYVGGYGWPGGLVGMWVDVFM